MGWAGRWQVNAYTGLRVAKAMWTFCVRHTPRNRDTGPCIQVTLFIATALAVEPTFSVNMTLTELEGRIYGKCCTGLIPSAVHDPFARSTGRILVTIHTDSPVTNSHTKLLLVTLRISATAWGKLTL